MYTLLQTNLNRPCTVMAVYSAMEIIPLAITSLGGAITLGLMVLLL